MLLLAATFCIAPPAQCQTYRLTKLDPAASGDTSSVAAGINNHGQVVGYTYTGANQGSSPDGDRHAALWNGPALTVIGSSNSEAHGINDAGVVAETVRMVRVAVWDGSTLTEIGDGSAAAINNAGEVAGSMVGCGAAVWIGTTMTDLGPCGGKAQSYGNGINDAGQVVGVSIYYLPPLRHVATLWDGATTISLDSLGGNYSWAYGINNAGQIVGSASLAGDAVFHAVEWNGTTVPTDLGTLGGSDARALAINNAGQVVGLASTPGDVTTLAVVWLDGRMMDLNTLIDPASPDSAQIALSEAVAINDNGWIAANGTGFANGQSSAFLLEPETLVLDVSPMLLDFGMQPIGVASVAQGVTITNKGAKPFNFNPMQVSGDYSQSNNCSASLSAGSSCTIQVIFLPTASGTRVGALTVASGGTRFSVDLTGVGASIQMRRGGSGALDMWWLVSLCAFAVLRWLVDGPWLRDTRRQNNAARTRSPNRRSSYARYPWDTRHR